MKSIQDVFVSHAGEDKQDYIIPLADALTEQRVTFWLDAVEIGWGDDVTAKINQGLRDSRYVLLCLSKKLIQRPWPEAEMSSALAIQNDSGSKRRTTSYSQLEESGIEAISTSRGSCVSGIQLRSAEGRHRGSKFGPGQRHGLSRQLHVVIESVHTGQLCNLSVDPKVSVEWLCQKGQAGLGLTTKVLIQEVCFHSWSGGSWLTLGQETHGILFHDLKRCGVFPCGSIGQRSAHFVFRP